VDDARASITAGPEPAKGATTLAAEGAAGDSARGRRAAGEIA
jgi:hypothetical protein